MKTLIIAEAGVNHNGDMNLAKQLIDVAATAGADIVKFQTFSAQDLVIRSVPKANYQIEANNKKLTPEYLKYISITSLINNTKFYFGESIPKYLTTNIMQESKFETKP